MRYAISAGVLVVRRGSVLLVRHRGSGFDFWVPPGGRLEGAESILACAAREAFEETGLRVVPERIAYVEEFVERDLHFCKFWTVAPDPGGAPTLAGLDPDETHVVDVRFIARSEIASLTVFPRVLRDAFWSDAERGFPESRYLGLTPIEG